MGIYEEVHWLENGEEADEEVLNRPLKKVVELLDTEGTDITIKEGIRVKREDGEPEAGIRWNETLNQWEITNEKGQYVKIGSIFTDNFYDTYYLDFINGSNDNDGRSRENPIKDLSFFGSFIDNKNILVKCLTSLETTQPKLRINNGFLRLDMDDSLEDDTRIELIQKNDDMINVKNGRFLSNSVFPVANPDAYKSLFETYTTTSNIALNGKRVYDAGGDYTIKGSDNNPLIKVTNQNVICNLFKVDCDNKIFGINMGNLILSVDSSNIDESNINGIIKDADSGNPINVVSNINFSD